MTTVGALLLDLDGTLLDGSRFRDSLVATCRELAASHKGLDADLLVEVNGQVWSAYWDEIGEAWTIGAADDAGVRREAWRRTLEACGCEDPELVSLAFDVHSRFAREGYRAFDDVDVLVEAVRSSPVPVGLITNGGSVTQREKLRALGIDDWFDVVIISGEVGVAKPDAEVFEHALEVIGVRDERAWHVGDSLAADVAGARASGVTSVWLNRDGVVRAEHDPEPHHEMRSLSELIPHLSGRI